MSMSYVFIEGLMSIMIDSMLLNFNTLKPSTFQIDIPF